MTRLPLNIQSWTITHSKGESQESQWQLGLEDVTVHSNALHLLVGENMSGKSTLLRVLASQQVKFSAASEKVRIGNVNALLSAADDPMFRDWSIQDNVFVVSKQLTKKKHVQRLGEFLKKVNSEFSWSLQASAPLRTCSTGARAFIHLARAFVFQPDVYLVDEITANLDETKLDFFARELAMLSNQGMGLVMVSHSDRDQEKMCATFSEQQSKVFLWKIIR